MFSPVRLSRTFAGTSAVVAATAASMLTPGAVPNAHAGAACPPPAPGVVRTAPGSGKTVALTFDDGPSAFTRGILAVLRKKDVRATFFDTGAHAVRRPGVETQMAAEGHLVEDHTWDHWYPTQVAGGWSRSYLSSQLSRTDRLQTRTTGRAPCFFRPPGGFVTSTVLPTARAHHLSVVLWSVDTEDWQQPAATSPAFVRQIVQRAAAGLAQSHPIVLMHDGKASHEPEVEVHANRSNDVAALPAVIDLYRRHGYRFVDLLGRSGLPPAPTTLRVSGGKERVPAGVRTLAVSGRLSAITGAVAGRAVQWYSRRPGASRWHLGGVVRTGAHGWARVYARPTEATEYTLRFPGSPAYRSSPGDLSRTLITRTYATEVSSAVATAVGDVAGAVIVTGTVSSAGHPRPGATVTITRTLSSGEVTVWRLRADRTGRVILTDTLTSSATYVLRVARSLPYAAGAATVTVTVPAPPAG